MTNQFLVVLISFLEYDTGNCFGGVFVLHIIFWRIRVAMIIVSCIAIVRIIWFRISKVVELGLA
jgi:hypothetical protein